MHTAGKIAQLFTDGGGKFLTPVVSIAERLDTIRAVVFDWDGVFNDGKKMAEGSSTFSEVDAMGTNLLRFAFWLRRGDLPLTAIITGERNESAQYLAGREHFDACYYRTGNKQKAFDHFCLHHAVKPEEVAYVFDDVLDLPIAAAAGLRIFIPRKSAPLLEDYVCRHGLADYLTGPALHPVRESCELMMGLLGNYDEALEHRIDFTESYQLYLKFRNAAETRRYTLEEGLIVAR